MWKRKNPDEFFLSLRMRRFFAQTQGAAKNDFVGEFFVCLDDPAQVKQEHLFREEIMSKTKSKAKKIGIGVAAVIAVLLVVIATRPDTYHVERSKTISASPDAIYGHVADFRKWNAWSPWEKLDPAMKKTYGGTQGAVGATYAWVGNDEAGTGDMTIASAEPGKHVEIDLHFIKPFEDRSKTRFKFEPEGKDTKVTWYMDGNNNFISKAMCLFMDMDKMIGKDFEKGLDSMKQVAEAAPAPAAAN